jgi:hypothetical protein
MTDSIDDFLDNPVALKHDDIDAFLATPATPVTTPKKSGIIANIFGSILEPAMQMGSGFIAKPVSEIMGMSAAAHDLITGEKNGNVQGFKEDIAKNLTYEPRTQGGQFVSQNILAPIGGVIEAGAQKLASTVTDNPIAQSGIKEAALQGVGFLGVKGAPKVRASMEAGNAAKAAELSTQAANDALRNQIRKQGQSIGLIAPADGLGSETLSKIGGADATLSIKNRATMTNKIAEDVGLPKGAISDADITARTSELVKPYRAVESALGGDVTITPQFQTEITNMLQPMEAKFAQDSKTFAALSEPIELLRHQLQNPTIEPTILMAKIRQLRKDARTFNKDTTGDPGKAAKAETSSKLANLYEDMVDESLQSQGKTGVLDSFRNARKQLSQIDIIDSTRLADGLIDPQKLASVVGRYGKDKRFVTGNLETAANFANTFKDVTKPISKSDLPTASRWELMAGLSGVGAAPVTGGMSLVGTLPLVARTVAPMLAERGMLQGRVPSYQLSAMRKAMPLSVEAGMLGGAFSPYAEEQK